MAKSKPSQDNVASADRDQLIAKTYTDGGEASAAVELVNQQLANGERPYELVSIARYGIWQIRQTKAVHAVRNLSSGVSGVTLTLNSDGSVTARVATRGVQAKVVTMCVAQWYEFGRAVGAIIDCLQKEGII
jgi:hypothetical protein